MLIYIPNLLQLKNFSLFLELYLSIMLLNFLVISVILYNNIKFFLIQGVISECVSIILFGSVFLIFNNSKFYYIFSHSDIKINQFTNCLLHDKLSFLAKIVICINSFLFFLIISDYLKIYKLTFEFIILLLFAVLGLLFMCSSNDFLLIFVSIELVSLSSYILTAIRKNSKNSVEAGIKYLIVGVISGAFFLLGVSFLYFWSGTILISDFKLLCSNIDSRLMSSIETEYYCSFLLYWLTIWCFKPYFFLKIKMDMLSDIELLWFLLIWYWQFADWTFDFYVYDLNLMIYIDQFLLFSSNSSSIYIVEIGLSLILISIFIKLSLAPFHLWSLDVYEGAPTIGTFFFAVITKLSFFIFLYRIYYNFFITYYKVFIIFSFIIGFFSIVIGSFGNLRQKKFKTFMAYSSINHMGFVLLAFSTGTHLGFEFSIFYLIIYMITNTVIWFSVLPLIKINTVYKLKYSNNFSDLILLYKTQPVIALGLLISFFSSAGIPPFIGFFAKLGIFFVLLDTGYIFISILISLCSVISAFYYIRVIKILYFENSLVGDFYKPYYSNKIILFPILTFCLVFLVFKIEFLFLIIHYSIYF